MATQSPHPPRGVIASARQSESPNQDARPAGCPIELIVLHNISLPPGEFGGPWIEDLFLNRLDTSAHPYFSAIGQLRVSAHCLIRRDGELIQFVPFDRRAWHAGQSTYCGREACNDFSIGIELEGDDNTPFTPAQYQQLAGLITELQRRYPAIGPEQIVGHSDIAPGRKTDPGPAFDWQQLYAVLGTEPQAK